MTSLKRLIKSALQKITKSDVLVLNPNWSDAGRLGPYILINTQGDFQKKYLPVKYNYHTGSEWSLNYALRGKGRGSLRYSLSESGLPAFLSVESEVELPYNLGVELKGGRLFLNGLNCEGRTAIPLQARILVAELEFASGDERLYRRMTHRVVSPGSQDETYFQGNVYQNYDQQALNIPGQVFGLIDLYHPAKGRLLDVGCATGVLVNSALERGLDAYGIDISPWAVEQANRRVGDRCRVIDFDTADIGDFEEPYDVIVAHSVLEHLADPERALSLAFRICKPGGVVYIQTLNADSLMHLIQKSDWAGYSDYTHKSPGITSDWLQTTAEKAGFEVLLLKRYYIWNENVFDDVWQFFVSMLRLYPASVLIEEQYGDAVEVILRRPV